MKTSITLDRMRFRAFHGVLPQERTVGNDFEISLTVNYPFAKAMTSDCLDDTLNYASLYDIVAQEMSVPSKLLENVAGRIITAVKAKFPAIEGGKITITKCTPPFKCQLDGVSICVEF